MNQKQSWQILALPVGILCSCWPDKFSRCGHILKK